VLAAPKQRFSHVCKDYYICSSWEGIYNTYSPAGGEMHVNKWRPQKSDTNYINQLIKFGFTH